MALALVLLAHANVYQYHDSVLRPNVIQYRRVGMYTAEDAPSHGAPGDGSSSITLKMEFRRTHFQQPGVIQLLVFHASQLPPCARDVRLVTCNLQLAACNLQLLTSGS